MLGISYGELFLLLGATAALIGPKDLPIIARTAGKLAGRAIGYVQLARGQFDTIMHQTQARQVHKELQDTIAQLEAIRHEIRTVSFMIPGPLTRRLVDNLDQTSAASGNNEPEKPDTANRSTTPDAKNYSSTNSGFSDMHSQATAYAKLAESTAINSESVESNEVINELTDESDNAEGSDIMLEAILEAEVAHKHASSIVISTDIFRLPNHHALSTTISTILHR
ncbi:hypothetical protein HYC85_024942 [Camellia sinensis]|uniref:Sec-independent protein translocase protein TatB n=1 Tax=Camellia sinensis TaxID=4442 RepID=A0A7J7GDP6_CAMSI|nr:hypothetical protein HYC85_024942 [Camellia sinensis]